MIYKNNTFNQFINLLFKKGKKWKIKKFILICFLLIRSVQKNPALIFLQAISISTPIVGLKKQKIKGKIKNIPILINKHKKKSISIKWILKGALIKKGFFCKNLSNELLKISKYKGFSYTKKIEISIFLENISPNL